MNTPVMFQHALLPVTQLQRSLQFYESLFPDWKIRWEGKDQEAGWVHFGSPDNNGPYLSIWELPTASADEAPNSLHVRHLGFSHPDVGGLMARLKERQVLPTEVVEDERFRRAYFTDPDGYDFEFVEAL